MPSSDTYIEKDSSINDEIDRLRHSATSALLSRRDVVIIASVSAIYGLGSPETYATQLLTLNVGEEHDQRAILKRLVELQYERNDMAFVRNKFRVRGDTIEIFPAYEERGIRVQLFGDEIERISWVDPVTGELVEDNDTLVLFPASPLRDPGGVAPARGRGHRGRADRPAQVARGPRQAARGAAPPHAHHVRPRDDARGRVVRRDRELLAPPRRSRRGRGAVHAARLLPEGLPRRPRREPRHRAPAPRPVRGRPLPQGHPRRARLPAAERDGQPAAAVRGVRRADQPGRVHVGHARARTSSRCRRARSSSRWCARRA